MTGTGTRRSRLGLVALAVGGLMLAGCGSEASTSSSPTGTPAATAPPPRPAHTLAGGVVVPEISNATDLTSKPVPSAAGEGAARPTKLVTEDLVKGTGKAAVVSDTVSVRYVGARYQDGGEFDSSWDRGSKPIAFPLTGVVPGFRDGIIGMAPGAAASS